MSEASNRQIEAARPDRSTWLSANAGSGKTRVLTDRVARLLLAGADPQNVLCLTYTKAAASEMQNRLFARLGGWAMMTDPGLEATLAELGEPAPDGARLRQARILFAQAIETPGGLRIQTIHSFCASLLRRFPLEAGVTPRFAEMDDRTAAALRAECIEALAEAEPALFAEIAAILPATPPDGLAQEIASRRDAFAETTPEEIRAALGLRPDESAETILADGFLGDEAELLETCRAALAVGSKTDRKAAEDLAGIAPPFTLDSLAALEGPLLYGGGAKDPFGPKTGKFPTKTTREALGDACDRLDRLMARVAEARPRRLALALSERSWLLNRFASAFLRLYARRKQAQGWLDFDDLILRARDLLRHEETADWILYRLDGGIDHILVDEAQDTSPTQWQVIEALAREFAAGEGARDKARTIFVVGDKKQSIYSFQGADPEGFDSMHDHFARRIGDRLARLELQHSFRSAPAILQAVDSTFAAGLGDGVSHRAFNDWLPGRVDLWPLAEPEPEPDPAEWQNPVDLPSPESATSRLARKVARWIAGLVERGETIPHRVPETGEWIRRPVHEGDILILVRGRSGVFHPLIRACKAEGLEIAGADVLALEDDLAVKDLLSLLRFLALPEDDLSLAEALRSPLLGLSEADLYRLAHGRGRRYLWQVLRDSQDHPGALATLRDLRMQADYLRPYELLEKILTRHRGRERLRGRLGPECIDAVDALLTEALSYERTEVPSLSGFLAWFDAGRVEVKRRADSGGHRLRVMTVHGAKGLEAPLVILPDTMRVREPQGSALLPLPEGPVLWRTGRESRPAAVAPLEEAREAAARAETERLLYVAMTRAAHWLVVCGAGKETDAEKAWHGRVAIGLAALATSPIETPTGEGRRFASGDWEGLVAPIQAERDAAEPAGTPDWIDAPAPPAAPKPTIVSPSGLGGAKVVPGEIASDAADETDALERGTRLHLLLEHLPAEAPELWPDRARRLLAADALPEAEIALLLDEAGRVLTNSSLRDLLARPALLEVDLTALIPGGHLLGTVDRLIVEAGRVTAIDYKSNRLVPESEAAIPEGLLRQMGAYAHALAQIYPGRRIETALLWTRIPLLMPVDPARAEAAFSATSA